MYDECMAVVELYKRYLRKTTDSRVLTPEAFALLVYKFVDNISDVLKDE